MAESQGDSFDVVIPEDIRADKANIPYLAIKQMDRISRLTSLGLAQGGLGLKEESVVKGIYFGCLFLESLLDLPPNHKYWVEKKEGMSVGKLKKYIIVRNTVEAMHEIGKWFALLVNHSQLRPAKLRTFEFDEAAPVWDEEDDQKSTKAHIE